MQNVKTYSITGTNNQWKVRSLHGLRDIIIGTKQEVTDEIYDLADKSERDICVILVEEDGTKEEHMFIRPPTVDNLRDDE